MPAAVPDIDADALGAVLGSAEFPARLRRAGRAALDAFPDLEFAHVTLSR